MEKVDLAKRNWRIEVWVDHRATEAEFDALVDGISELCYGLPREKWDPIVSAVKKEISEP